MGLLYPNRALGSFFGKKIDLFFHLHLSKILHLSNILEIFSRTDNDIEKMQIQRKSVKK